MSAAGGPSAAHQDHDVRVHHEHKSDKHSQCASLAHVAAPDVSCVGFKTGTFLIEGAMSTQTTAGKIEPFTGKLESCYFVSIKDQEVVMPKRCGRKDAWGQWTCKSTFVESGEFHIAEVDNKAYQNWTVRARGDGSCFSAVIVYDTGKIHTAEGTLIDIQKVKLPQLRKALAFVSTVTERGMRGWSREQLIAAVQRQIDGPPAPLPKRRRVSAAATGARAPPPAPGRMTVISGWSEATTGFSDSEDTPSEAEIAARRRRRLLYLLRASGAQMAWLRARAPASVAVWDRWAAKLQRIFRAGVSRREQALLRWARLGRLRELPEVVASRCRCFLAGHRVRGAGWEERERRYLHQATVAVLPRPSTSGSAPGSAPGSAKSLPVSGGAAALLRVSDCVLRDMSLTDLVLFALRAGVRTDGAEDRRGIAEAIAAARAAVAGDAGVAGGVR